MSAELAMLWKVAQKQPFHVGGADGAEVECHPPVTFPSRLEQDGSRSGP